MHEIDLNSKAVLERSVRQYARRGVRLQILLRAALVLFVVLTVAIVPPEKDKLACDVLAGAYSVWALAVGAWGWGGRSAALRFAWVALFVDLAVLATLTLLAGASAQQSWTAYVLVNGFFLIPPLAAAQLRPEACAAVTVPTVAVYLLSSILTKSANAEPWDSILLRTLVLCGLGGSCVALSSIQRSRVATIIELIRERSGLLGELIGTEDRERLSLAEHLHDGALQYVLAARYDLEDARELGDPAAFERLDRALTESSRLLRSTVTELHPAVLEQAGLAHALRELATSTGETGGIEMTLELDGWSVDQQTSADRLLYSTARELLANVVKHARARSATVTLAHDDGRAVLTIIDDGCGIPDSAVSTAVRDGHIGLDSYRVRVGAAGGTFSVTRARPAGTIARIELPTDATRPTAGPPTAA